MSLLDRTAGRPAGDALRAPFVLGDRNRLAALFAESGATAVEIKTLKGVARFPGIRSMVGADLRGWLPAMGVMLSEDDIEHILREAETTLRPYAGADGRVSFPLSAHLATATRA